MEAGTSQYPIILHVKSLMKGVTAEQPPDVCHTQNCVARVLWLVAAETGGPSLSEEE